MGFISSHSTFRNRVRVQTWCLILRIVLQKLPTSLQPPITLAFLFYLTFLYKYALLTYLIICLTVLQFALHRLLQRRCITYSRCNAFHLSNHCVFFVLRLIYIYSCTATADAGHTQDSRPVHHYLLRFATDFGAPYAKY